MPIRRRSNGSHIPLSSKATTRSYRSHVTKPQSFEAADGNPITLPNKEMAMGVYYLTTLNESLRKPDEEQALFSDYNTAIMAYDLGEVAIREPIKVRVTDLGETKVIESSVGRLKFNERLPEGFGLLTKVSMLLVLRS